MLVLRKLDVVPGLVKSAAPINRMVAERSLLLHQLLQLSQLTTQVRAREGLTSYPGRLQRGPQSLRGFCQYRWPPASVEESSVQRRWHRTPTSL